MAGGLAEYLGADANVVRLGFVLVSVMCLAVFGGLLLYALACAVIPEESPAPSPALGPPAQAWDRPDRTARSWALVLGATAAALIWSFGLARWWHSGAPVAWLVFGGAAFWFFTRSRRSGRCASRPIGSGGPGGPRAPAGPDGPGVPSSQAGPGGPAGPDLQAGPGGPAGPDLQAGPGGPAGPDLQAAPGGAAGPDLQAAPASTGPGYARDAGNRSASGQPGPAPAGPAEGASPPFGLSAEEAADWAAARAAAQGWAEEQLAAAGVPPLGANPPGPAGASRRPRRARPVRALLAALMAGLMLLFVAGVIGTTLASGASLGGGVGNATMTPATLSQVRTHYRLGVGRLDVDLSQVNFPRRGETVDMSVGVGQLRLVLPRGTLVQLDAASGIAGNVHLPDGSDTQSAHTQLSMPPGLGAHGAPAHKLTVKAHVGVGVVDVSWGP